VLVSIYLKSEEFSKAESLLDEYEFPPRGTADLKSLIGRLCHIVYRAVEN
jgi:hypothetical protein